MAFAGCFRLIQRDQRHDEVMRIRSAVLVFALRILTKPARTAAPMPRGCAMQVRLTWLILLVGVVAAILGFYYSPANREQRAVKRLQDQGVDVYFEHQREADGSTYSHQSEAPGPEIVRSVTGDGLFQDAAWVRLHDKQLDVNDLATLPDLPNLRQLTLTNCGLTDEHLGPLTKLPKLETIDLKNNSLTDAALESFRGMTKLETVSLSTNKIQGAGCVHLVELPLLTQLFLHDNPVSDEGLSEIAKLTNLELLGLAGSKVTDAGLDQLAELKRLKYLGLTRTQVTRAGAARLQAKLPDCEIEF